MVNARGYQPREVVAWCSAIIVLVFLYLSHKRFEKLDRHFQAYRDTVRVGLRSEYMARDSALHEGESLPQLSVIDGSGVIRPLKDLPRLGYRYIYLYRDECVACRTLASTWNLVPHRLRDSLAFVVYRKNADAQPQSVYEHGFGMLTASHPATYPLTKYVPALLVVRPDGRISSIGDGMPGVIRLLAMNGILPDSTLESLASSPGQPVAE